jgi:hypothetical protein
MKFFDSKVTLEDMEIFSFPDLSFKYEEKRQLRRRCRGTEYRRENVPRNSAYPAAQR